MPKPTKRGTIESWDKYQFLVGFPAGADYVLDAVEESERKLGIG
jgi:hypothetical protein